MTTEYENGHRLILELLPWHINKSLPDEENQMVLQHLRNCVSCRSEAARLEAMAHNVAEPAEQGISMHAFSTLMARIEANEARASSRFYQPLQRRLVALGNTFAQVTMPVRALLVVETLLLIFAGIWLWQPSNEMLIYRTLSAPVHDSAQPQQARFRVVFAGSTTMKTAEAILSAVEAQVVAGPSSVGAYVVAVSHADDAQVLQYLRAHAQVELAEPLLR